MINKTAVSLPCYYFETDEAGLLQQVNELLCHDLGYRVEELTGRKLDTIFTMSSRIFFQTHVLPLLKMKGYVNEIFMSLKTKDNGSLPVLFNVSRNAFIGMLVENRNKFEQELIQARKTAENAIKENTLLVEARKELSDKYEELDRQLKIISAQNQELEQFNKVLTHDLQEPLRKLLVFANLMNDHNNSSSSIDPTEIKNKFSRAAQNLQTVISGMQQYAWLSGTNKKIEVLNIDSIIEKARETLSVDFPDAQLEITRLGHSTIYGDAAQLETLFYQILANAVKFRKVDTASVEISVDTIQKNIFQDSINQYKYAEYDRIQIRDEGIGFDPIYKDNIFGLFSKLTSGPGAGLGLSLVRKIMDNHQGTVSAEGRPGDGATFTLLLPKNSAT